MMALHRIALAAVLAGLSAAACDTQPAHLIQGRDSEGHLVLPERCKDLAVLRALNVPIIYVPRDAPILGRHDGRWVLLFGAVPTIYIRNDLAEWYRQDVEDHERCHHKYYVETGNAQFHH